MRKIKINRVIDPETLAVSILVEDNTIVDFKNDKGCINIAIQINRILEVLKAIKICRNLSYTVNDHESIAYIQLDGRCSSFKSFRFGDVRDLALWGADKWTSELEDIIKRIYEIEEKLVSGSVVNINEKEVGNTTIRNESKDPSN